MPHSGDQQDTKGPTGIAGVLRNLGRLNRSHPASPAATTANHGFRASGPEYFGGPPNNDLLFAQLKAGSPIPDRIAAAAQFRTIVADYALSSLTEIWLAAQDMLDPQNPPDARQAALKLMTACIKQSEPSSLDRLHYYRIISSHPCLDDFDDQLLALVALTNSGKNVTSFEKDILSLLAKWIRVWFREAGHARQARKRENSSTVALSAGEFNFSQLMKFVTDIVKFNHSAFEERQVNALLLEILSVCRKTTNRADIQYSLTFIDVLITYGYIPRQTLPQCIEVLCGAYTTVTELSDSTWSAVANLCRSYMAHNTILVLRETLEAPSKKSPRANNSLRGAVYLLERLLLANEADGLPAIQFSAVMASFRAALSANNARLDVDIVKAISSAFHSEEVMSHVSFDEWAVPLGILVECSKRTTERADGTKLETSNTPASAALSASAHSRDKDNIGSAISSTLLQMIILLEGQCIAHKDPTLTESVVEFFTCVHGHLPDSAADMVIEYYATEHLCYPSCPDWMSNIRALLNMFFKSKIRPARLRISVLTLVKDVYETIKGVWDEDEVHSMVLSIFDDIREETDGKVLDALVRIAVDVAGDGNKTMFDKVVGILAGFIPTEEQLPDQAHLSSRKQDRTPNATRAPSIASQAHNYGSHLNIITTGLVRIFIRNMHTSARKAARIFLEIVKVAGCVIADTDARLTAMRLLFRIRSDAENAILLVESTESESMANFLGRLTKPEGKEGNAAVQKEEDTHSNSLPNRSSSVSQPLLPFRTPIRSIAERPDAKQPRLTLWSYPEKRPLPEHFNDQSSPILVTYKDPPPAEQLNENTPPEKILQKENCVRMSLWMEVIIPIIQKGTDWEIYSYVLVNLSSQLSNKTAFRNCIPHIRHLRACICDQLHTNKIPNTDLPPELRKADIAVVLIHLLTTLICYHEHFARSEQEAIVKAFQLGLHSWQRTAKPCIHALSVCCYELPMPTSKFLSGILTKLSQIITSSAVSVHILEFLSALARLPNLYTNFTEPDFRNVFGIAFRYIQHTKETTAQQMQRPGYPGRMQKDTLDALHPEQSQLPQYVLALAYNVLTTWFLSLKLCERAKYVPWITRGLVLGDNTNSKDYIDEQSQACIDMLQRFTYSDSEAKPSGVRTGFQDSAYIQTRNWLNGMSIISVRMNTLTGDAELTVRKPSGTSSYRLALRSSDPSTTQTLVTVGLDKPQPYPFVMPSHIILQLLASVGATSESCRPVLLPDDSRTQLALDVFDRIPVVDFHKIGVVYVGAGQSQEQEILHNAMGSTDYTEFVTGLGNLIPLKDTKINTGGLDTEFNSDGEFAIFWSDRVTEIIFHVTTMMPVNLDYDPQCTMKKRHIGNDFVNIIFNNSGIPYAFDTIPAQFNFVNIIISPEARAGFVTTRPKNYSDVDKEFYRVELQCKPGIPAISPAAETKVISGKSLPAFVRNLALNASVFAHVHNEGGGEHISMWRHRLRHINKLRERTSAPLSTGLTTAASPTAIGGSSSPVITTSRRISTATVLSELSSRGSAALNGDGLQQDGGGEVESILNSFDFSRWS
ncbi:hypothetical protein L211DRAFT_491798 [Terfezia boudieri ATCC MYA-4762]|uniref:Rap-GAP domain-containing protein n=1 Tax=Terfezia boudieri ATCC MYA-4762 TaxID=1051890 RepID=A0A3N4LD14_9PEZI|nr:hypothetical protein L211DRAFT_491798 [Terfezia boudieri ATCC MYA-4762]